MWFVFLFLMLSLSLSFPYFIRQTWFSNKKRNLITKHAFWKKIQRENRILRERERKGVGRGWETEGESGGGSREEWRVTHLPSIHPFHHFLPSILSIPHNKECLTHYPSRRKTHSSFMMMWCKYFLPPFFFVCLRKNGRKKRRQKGRKKRRRRRRQQLPRFLSKLFPIPVRNSFCWRIQVLSLPLSSFLLFLRGNLSLHHHDQKPYSNTQLCSSLLSSIHILIWRVTAEDLSTSELEKREKKKREKEGIGKMKMKVSAASGSVWLTEWLFPNHILLTPVSSSLFKWQKIISCPILCYTSNNIFGSKREREKEMVNELLKCFSRWL